MLRDILAKYYRIVHDCIYTHTYRLPRMMWTVPLSLQDPAMYLPRTLTTGKLPLPRCQANWNHCTKMASKLCSLPIRQAFRLVRHRYRILRFVICIRSKRHANLLECNCTYFFSEKDRKNRCQTEYSYSSVRVDQEEYLSKADDRNVECSWEGCIMWF